eukprot:1829640-Rhodomonas_salina.2
MLLSESIPSLLVGSLDPARRRPGRASCWRASDRVSHSVKRAWSASQPAVWALRLGWAVPTVCFTTYRVGLTAAQGREHSLQLRNLPHWPYSRAWSRALLALQPAVGVTARLSCVHRSRSVVGSPRP